MLFSTLSKYCGNLLSLFRVAQLDVSPKNLPPFLANQGSGSVTDFYMVRMTNLRNNLPMLTQVFVSAPDGFEISLNENAGFSNQVMFASPDSSEKVVSFTKIIFIRLKANLAPGTYDGDIFHSNAQTGNVTLPVSGIVGPTKVRIGHYPFSPDFWSLTNHSLPNKKVTRDARPR